MTADRPRVPPFRKAEKEDPVDRTRLATLALHICIVLYVMAGLLLALSPLTWDWVMQSDATQHASAVWLLALVCLGVAGLCFAVTKGLRRRRRWAWTTALVIFIVHLPSLLLPAGALGLFGLLSEGTRARFRESRLHRA